MNQNQVGTQQQQEEKENVSAIANNDIPMMDNLTLEEDQQPVSSTTANNTNANANKHGDDDAYYAQEYFYETGDKLQTRAATHIKEHHKYPIYAIAWSTDIFSRYEYNDEEDEEDEEDNNDNTTTSVSMMDEEERKDESDPSKQTATTTTRRKERKKRYYRCFATVAGPLATVYEVEIPDPCLTTNSNQQQSTTARASTTTPADTRSGKFILKQSYYDPTPNEDLYACAFGGRSFSSVLASETENSSILQEEQQQTKKIRLAYEPNNNNSSSSSNNNNENSNNGENGSSVNGGNDGAVVINDNNHHQHQQQQQQRDENNNNDSTIAAATENDVYGAPVIPLSDLDLQDPSGPQFLCVAGKCYNIKVIDTARRQLWMTLSGHGEEIYSLKFSPIDQNMLLSTSNDRSCRIWNIRTGVCVAILAGHWGHKDIVMSANWHCLGNKIVSGGHDNLVKIWDVGQGTKIHTAMEQSYKIPLQIHPKNQITVESRDHFEPVTCQFPIFSTNKVHVQPVDCVEFVGDLVLSKASNMMVLWDPDYSNPDGNPLVTVPPPERLVALRTLTIPNMDDQNHVNMMHYRFCTSADGRFVAVGNAKAELWLMDIDDFHSKSDKLLNLNHQRSWKQPWTVVRMVTFSPDGRILLCCCDDGRIWKWDITRS